MGFSNRAGLTLVPNFQKGCMTEELKNCLWNPLYRFYRERIAENGLPCYSFLGDVNINRLFEYYWDEFLKKPLNILPNSANDRLELLRQYFFGFPWYTVYDFWEWTINFLNDWLFDEMQVYVFSLEEDFNNICERENSAYRFINGIIAPITSDIAIDAIEKASSANDVFKHTSSHIQRALELLSNKTKPDYRNSIKESISAVECAARIITNNDKATLGEILKNLSIAPALKGGLSKIYGWTSNSDGIRHALMEEPNISFEESHLMIVLCSAFVNYLRDKCSE